MTMRHFGQYADYSIVGRTERPTVRHWLLLQLTLGAAGWAVIAFGISYLV
jgi:hypothetical protein